MVKNRGQTGNKRRNFRIASHRQKQNTVPFERTALRLSLKIIRRPGRWKWRKKELKFYNLSLSTKKCPHQLFLILYLTNLLRRAIIKSSQIVHTFLITPWILYANSPYQRKNEAPGCCGPSGGASRIHDNLLCSFHTYYTCKKHFNKEASLNGCKC